MEIKLTKFCKFQFFYIIGNLEKINIEMFYDDTIYVTIISWRKNTHVNVKSISNTVQM
jgi:hypothetical protein